MSDATHAALEAAIQAHVADEYNEEVTNGLVSGYVLKAHVINMDSNDHASHYFFVKPKGQAYHETYGLLVTAQDDFVASAMEASNDD